MHPLPSRHLLVVDDDYANRMLPGLFMRERGWLVTECASADEARQVLAGGQVTHVLLDISLPRISGLEFCKQLRAGTPPTQPLRIYAYTAHAMPDQRHGFLSAGFDGVLLKPIRQADLLGMLEP